MTRAIIIHGNYGGTGNDAWIPWLKAELEKLGITVQNPTMPDNHEAKMSVWLPYLENELKPDEHTVIIGWSSGAVAAMRYAEQHTILGSVLIGAYHTNLNNELEKIGGWCEALWNWEAIKANQQWIVQFASSDDPVIPINEARVVHEKLSTDYIEVADGKHFGYPDPMPDFPALLKALKRHLS